MKLFRHGPRGHERPGLVDGQGVMRDLSAQIGDIAPGDLAPARLARHPSQTLVVRVVPRHGKARVATSLAFCIRLWCEQVWCEEQASAEFPEESFLCYAAGRLEDLEGIDEEVEEDLHEPVAVRTGARLSGEDKLDLFSAAKMRARRYTANSHFGLLGRRD